MKGASATQKNFDIRTEVGNSARKSERPGKSDMPQKSTGSTPNDQNQSNQSPKIYNMVQEYNSEHKPKVIQ